MHLILVVAVCSLLQGLQWEEHRNTLRTLTNIALRSENKDVRRAIKLTSESDFAVFLLGLTFETVNLVHIGCFVVASVQEDLIRI